MMTQPFPAHQGIPQHPGLPPGHHPMAQAQHPNMGVQAPGMVQQMHPGVSAAGPQVSQPGPMMGGMPPGATTGPGGPVANAHALQHLNPAQAHILQQQQYGMSKLPFFFSPSLIPLHPVFPIDSIVQKMRHVLGNIAQPRHSVVMPGRIGRALSRKIVLLQY